MRFLTYVLCVFILSACAGTNYRYQSENKPQQWQGRNIADVQKQWGAATNVMGTRSGTSYYMYVTNATGDFYRSTVTNFSMAGTNESGITGPLNNQVGLKCTTIFTTDKNGTITNVSHQGSNCGGEWVPR